MTVHTLDLNLSTKISEHERIIKYIERQLYSDLAYSLERGRPYPRPCIGVELLVVPPMSPPVSLTLVAEVNR